MYFWVLEYMHGDMMGFKGKQFIKVAEEIDKKYKSEPYQRTAVGRYYYGCFLTGRGYYEFKTHKKLGKDGAHDRLINYFKYSNNSNEKEIGKTLEKMRGNISPSVHSIRIILYVAVLDLWERNIQKKESKNGLNRNGNAKLLFQRKIILPVSWWILPVKNLKTVRD